jgi:hypothetical protein
MKSYQHITSQQPMSRRDAIPKEEVLSGKWTGPPLEKAE